MFPTHDAIVSYSRSDHRHTGLSIPFKASLLRSLFVAGHVLDSEYAFRIMTWGEQQLLRRNIECEIEVDWLI
jgi:hypothetical protein